LLWIKNAGHSPDQSTSQYTDFDALVTELFEWCFEGEDSADGAASAETAAGAFCKSASLVRRVQGGVRGGDLPGLGE